MKLSFIYKTNDDYWNDGLKKAIDVLGEDWQVRKFNGYYKTFLADFVLVWSAFGGKMQKLALEIPVLRKGICVAGGPVDHPDIHEFDVVFVENEWYKREFRKRGVNAIVAFGTNNDIFKDRQIPRHIDRIYPAAYAKWKRHERFLKKDGLKLAVGYIQPGGHERECFDMCVEDENTIAMPMVKPETLSWLYNQSKIVSITSSLHGGGERAILEGLSCGCNIEVEEDNPKLVELLDQMQKFGVPSYVDYASRLKEGITECLKESW